MTFVNDNFLEGKIEKFEGRLAIIVLADGQRLTWPLENLPADLNSGSKIKIILSSDKTEKELAKEILNEILSSDSDEK